MRIRFANVGDAETIHRFIVELAVFELAPDAVETTPEILRRQLASPRPPFECFIALTDDVPVGFALFFPTYSTWRGRPGIHLEDLYVTPAARGKGVGRALLAKLAALCTERDCARLEWAVLDWNEPAIEFYRALNAKPMAEWITYRLTRAPLEQLALEA